MEAPCFLRSGSAGDMTLGHSRAQDRPSDQQVWGHGRAAPPSSPEVSRNGDRAAATLAVRTTSSSYDAAVHAGPVFVCSCLGWTENLGRLGEGPCPPVHPPCSSLLLPPAGFTLGLF